MPSPAAPLQRSAEQRRDVLTITDAPKPGVDAEIAARAATPVRIPWGAKDIISVSGFKTTWGSPAFKEQSFDYDASVVEMLRDAGAVLIAKLATGELAGGDQWFGGQTKNPWDPTQGSSGSSAGPSSATSAGCVAFGIGTETS
jgi:Asp-tRNA(Asn)/Glu-tRNA(Gln) amidotransferase A subunit family amidase